MIALDRKKTAPYPDHDSSGRTRVFPVQHYDLDATLTSGQAFRWQKNGDGWVGVVGRRWVRLCADTVSITAETAEPVSDWSWLIHYLQLDLELAGILLTFPDDEPMRAAVLACHGLRLLRQEPWECLASFILSSTKQILQIQQIIRLLCERFGDPLPAPRGFGPAYAFPSPARLAAAEEAELRACKMGFRAPYLLAVARRHARGQFDPEQLRQLPVETARDELMRLPGVGRKIADCTLLFGLGLQSAFPVDVWVAKALRQLYFPRRKVNLPRLHRFAAAHFGPNAGYAQQYLFHYMRTRRSIRSNAEEPLIDPAPQNGIQKRHHRKTAAPR
jgi:N-glycosylase/DNA lyase